MQTISAGFRQAIASSHTRTSKAVLLVDGKPHIELPITGGEVTVDGEAAIRRRCSVDMVATDTLIPELTTDLMFPHINEMQIYTGVLHETGAAEYVPLGIFRIIKPEVKEDSSGIQLSCEGYDRAQRVSSALLRAPYVVAEGLSYDSALELLLTYVDPTIETNFPTIPLRTPRAILDLGADPWEQAISIATTAGYDLFFDVNGVCTLQAIISDTDAEPCWYYVEGEGNLVTSIQKTLDSDQGANHIVVTTDSSESDPLVLAEAWDSDPNSPTFAGDPLGSSSYGRVTVFLSSPLVVSAGQASIYARAQLRKLLGAEETVRFESLVNPAHEAGDVIQITRARTKVDGLYRIRSMTVPLAADGTFEVETVRL